MWQVKSEPMTENPSDGEQQLWKVAVYQDDKFMSNHAEGLTKKEAELVARELQKNFDDH